MNFQEAINEIATSIVNEQTAITELLKQEAAKIQKFIDEGATADELLQVNESAQKLIDNANKLDKLLEDKLALIAPYLQK